MTRYTRRKHTRKPRGRVVATYDYRNERGKMLYQVLRYQPKGFSYRHLTRRGTWLTGLGTVRLVPYCLPELLAADRRKLVYVVEGEKDVDRLWSLGLVATCNSGGGGHGKWPRSHNRLLAGRDVAILPDNDYTGEEHALDVARNLHQKARSVRIVKLPRLPLKGDVSDWLDAGGDLRTLRRLVSATPPWAVTQPPPKFDREAFFQSNGFGEILTSHLSTQEKLLLMILESRIVWPALTQEVLGGYMSLSARRVKQILAGLRRSEVVSVYRVGRHSRYQVDTWQLRK